MSCREMRRGRAECASLRAQMTQQPKESTGGICAVGGEDHDENVEPGDTHASHEFA